MQELPENPDTHDDISFEEALRIATEQVNRLESGNLSLEEALAAVEIGKKYLSICRAKLEQAKGQLIKMQVEIEEQMPSDFEPNQP
jgi:exodeoxyribonuclease VII small subunit